MTIFGNIFLALGALIQFALISEIYKGRPPQSGDAAAGYPMSVILFNLAFGACMALVCIAIAWKGGFDWVSPNRSTRFFLVAFGLLSSILLCALSALFKYESGPVPFLFRYLTGAGPALFPMIMLAAAAVLLNDGIRAAVPAPVYQYALTGLLGLGGLALAGLIGVFIAQQSQNLANRGQEMAERGARIQAQHLSEIEANDPLKNMSYILIFTDKNHAPVVREKAIAKVKTNPGWQQELVRLLENQGAIEAFTFLASNEPEDKNLFAGPVDAGVRSVAGWVRRRIREASATHHFHADQFSWNIERLLATVEKYKGMGVDYRPAIRDLRTAFDEPSEFKKVEFEIISSVDAWLKRNP